ncbi:hypothetical protein B0H14DRAFT_2923441 [Mycena olivaceomarginata]|nr:hypothetical protein B0H14DRAFT_2923441 [Mycena olivaceomarginata]
MISRSCLTSLCCGGAACFREPHDAEGVRHIVRIYRDMLTLLRENGLQKTLPCAYLPYASRSRPWIVFLGNGLGPTKLSARCPSLITVCVVWCGPRTPSRGTMENGQHPGLDHPMETCRGLRRQVPVPETHKGISQHIPPQTIRVRVPPIQSTSLCDVCAELAETTITTGRAKMWENLPSFFDLHPWSELKNSNEM